jgi:hypothetical protein
MQSFLTVYDQSDINPVLNICSDSNTVPSITPPFPYDAEEFIP